MTNQDTDSKTEADPSGAGSEEALDPRRDPGAEPVVGEGGNAAAEDANAPEDPEMAIARLTEKVDALQDQALRAQAESENIRRRAQRDVENAHKFALEKFVGELLPVVDSLERAVDSIPTGPEAADNGAQAIGEGVESARKLFVDTVAKFGVEQIDPHGEPFDPQRHEAMSMIENPNMEPGSVMQVLQKGYALNGRLVRAAMVIVSKAPPGSAGIDEQA